MFDRHYFVHDGDASPTLVRSSNLNALVCRTRESFQKLLGAVKKLGLYFYKAYATAFVSCLSTLKYHIDHKFHPLRHLPAQYHGPTK